MYDSLRVPSVNAATRSSSGRREAAIHEVKRSVARVLAREVSRIYPRRSGSYFTKAIIPRQRVRHVEFHELNAGLP